MNFATLKRISDLEEVVESLKAKVADLEAKLKEERRTLTLPKKDAGYRQAT